MLMIPRLRAQPRHLRLHVAPGRFVAGIALAQIIYQRRHLPIGKAVLKARHKAHPAVAGLGIPLQDHLDQVIGAIAEDIGVIGQIRADAEQLRPAGGAALWQAWQAPWNNRSPASWPTGNARAANCACGSTFSVALVLSDIT